MQQTKPPFIPQWFRKLYDHIYCDGFFDTGKILSREPFYLSAWTHFQRIRHRQRGHPPDNCRSTAQAHPKLTAQPSKR